MKSFLSEHNVKESSFSSRHGNFKMSQKFLTKDSKQGNKISYNFKSNLRIFDELYRDLHCIPKLSIEFDENFWF